jgi:Holliday junction resolvase RusA-like endonuclease
MGDGELTDVVRIILAGEPEPYRERQRAFQRGKTGAPITYSYKVGSTRQYQAWLRDAAQQAMEGRELFDCAVEMTMTAYMPIPKSMRKAERILAERELLPVTKRPDTTQLLKAAEDAFNQVVWTDDARVSDHVLRRRYSPRPRLEILVRPLIDGTDLIVRHRSVEDDEPAARSLQGALL